MHAQTSGHDEMNFAMLHESFRDQVRNSQSAPVHVEGGGIGMIRCSREVLRTVCDPIQDSVSSADGFLISQAFESLISVRVFEAASSSTSSIDKDFALYRYTISRQEVKNVVDATGQINFKRWFTKAPQ